MRETQATIIRCDENPPGGREDFLAAVASAFPREAYFEFGGGLGDIINLTATTDVFTKLEEPGDDPVVLVLVTHNPHAWEVFGFHPRAERLVILNLPISEYGVQYRRDDEAFRRRHGLPIPCVNPKRTRMNGFVPYPTSEDLSEIAFIQKPFAVFSMTASCGPNDPRSVPARIVESATRTAIAAGIIPVFVGKTYSVENRFNPIPHVESDLPPVEGVISMIDRLTVPGACELVRRAAVTVACDSAIGCAARAMCLPTFNLVHDEMWAACKAPEIGHGQMMYETFYYCSFRAYSDELLSTFFRRFVR